MRRGDAGAVLQWVWFVAALLESILPTSPVPDAEDFEALGFQAINYDIWRDHKLAGSGAAALLAKLRKLRQMLDAAYQMIGDALGSRRLDLRNVVFDLGQVGDCLLGPDYLHEGVGSLRLLPQDWRYRLTAW